MAKTTIVFGLLLIGLGVFGYVGGGGSAAPSAETDLSTASEAAEAVEPAKKSVTALIPAFVGAALALCGLLAMKESMLKHAMHGAAMIGLLGTLAGAGRGAMGLGKFFSGDPSLNQRSFLFVWLMALICGAFVFLCVRSFIAVRKRREAAEPTT
ncbi:MAG: hypothetical protein AAGJ40_17255 [Planctomycetota bacterium]